MVSEKQRSYLDLQTAMILLFWLLVGHCLADYPLQGDFLARAKNHRDPLPGIPWQICLAAHALIHAGAVVHFVDNIWIGAAEFVAHCIIDWLKSEKITTFAVDQFLHVICKVAWVWLILG